MRVEGLVSTIIPVFNRPVMLGRAVESVLRQTYRPIEVIIVDDGSNDDTPRRIASLVSAEPGTIRGMRRPNGGPGAARQSGLGIANGEFIQFLDSDDLLLPEKFRLQVDALRKCPDAGVAYGKTRQYRFGESPKDLPMRRTGELIRTMFPSFLRSRWWSTSTPLYRRSLIHHAGPWTSLRNEEDWEFDCRIASFGVALAYCDAFVSEKLEHGAYQLSANGSADPDKLRDRAEAHRLIFGHARRGGVGQDAPEMRHFARELFLLARQCGATGLATESAMLFELARTASTPERRQGLDFRLYGVASRVLGWRNAGLIAQAVDHLRGLRRALEQAR